jgi:hypothetical protein
MRGAIAMSQPLVWITAPVLSDEVAVWFSAYGFGWGYRAFSVSLEVFRESLGVNDIADEQIRLAFSAGKHQILEAVLQHGSSPYAGKRIRLSLVESIDRIRGEQQCNEESS